MKPRPFLLQPVALGLLFGLAIALLLSHWFFTQARTGLASDQQERSVIMQAMALADAVPLITSGDNDDPSSSALQALLVNWSNAYPDTVLIRVISLSGSRLLASTLAQDEQSGPLPRRLKGEEKWLYDLGQTLRTAVETNQDEGVFRKKQVTIEYLNHDAVRITLPYYTNSRVAGIVQLQLGIERVRTQGSWVPVGTYMVIPLMAFFIVMYLFRQRMHSAESAQAKPWGRYLFAVALFSTALFIYGQQQLAELADAQQQLSAELATTYSALRENIDAYTDLPLAINPDQVVLWDVDHYQRPLGILRANGSIDVAALLHQVAQTHILLVKSLWGNWLLGLTLLSFVALGYGRRLRKTLVKNRYAYLYVMPAIIGMLFLVFFPFSFGIVLSFTDQTLFNINLPIWDIWVWFENYMQILGDFNAAQSSPEGWVFNYQNFYWTLFITICWTLFNVTIGVSIGMLLALALNTEGLKYKAVYRMLLILPWAIPNYITALIWKGMFHPQFGVINQAIIMFGGEPVAWFDSVFTSFLTGIITNGWLSFPFMMVVILGALQSISADMYEAARVEGASRWQQFVYITLPSLKPTLIPAVIISVVWTFNMFNIIYLVSEGQPAGANEILITEAYKIAFEKYQYGYAAAYSVVVFIILLIYGVFQTKATRATEAIA